jgi:hypothetical protein
MPGSSLIERWAWGRQYRDPDLRRFGSPPGPLPVKITRKCWGDIQSFTKERERVGPVPLDPNCKKVGPKQV